MGTPRIFKFGTCAARLAVYTCLASLLWQCSREHKETGKTTQEFSIETLSEKEEWLEKFLTDFFLDGEGVYTVMGSKPMSCKGIITASSDEWRQAHEPFFQELSEEEQVEARNLLEETICEYDLNETWEKWESLRMRFPHSRFLFRKTPTDSPHVFIVNILNSDLAAETISIYKSLFSRLTPLTSDPTTLVSEFEDPESQFWKKVFDNHLLMGLLYGFGEKNSSYFQLTMKIPDDHNLFLLLPSFLGPQSTDEVSPQKLKIPSFRSYEQTYFQDPVYQKFVQEKNDIEKYFREHDFVKEMLSRLLPTS